MDYTRKAPRANPFAKASLLSKVLFFWVLPLFREGKRKDLELDDLYDPVEDDLAGKLGDDFEKEWMKRLKEGKDKGKPPSLVGTLFAIVGTKYLFSSVGVLIGETIFRISEPIVLRELIKSFAENSTVSKRDQYLLAVGVCMGPLLTTLFYHPSAFQLYRVSMRCRLALSSLIYRKALRLSTPAQHETNMGAIVNLLSNDVNRFDQTLIYFLYLPIGTAQLVAFSVLLWLEFGLVGLSGVALLLLLMPLQYYNLKLATKFRLQIAERTDERGRVMNEIITGIRILKMYAWEKPFSAVIQHLRKLELKPLRNRLNVRGFCFILYSVGVKLFVFITVLTYFLEGNDLTADKVFFAATVFHIVGQIWLTPVAFAISGFGEIKICLQRIQTFLQLEEKRLPDNFICSDSLPPDNQPKITLEGVSAKWNPNLPENLSQVTTSLSGDNVVIIAGQCGAGKSSLLQALLGELPILPRGKCTIHGKISYAGQEPWIFAGTVKQNILFGREFVKEKYDRVVKAAALVDDFDQFAYADNTIVGERGVALSGGQKARVSLARCLYQDADIYLLDDPLSAVDSKVSRHLFENCVKKHLTGKLRILVTHQLQYLPQADHIIVLNQGKILAQGTHEELINAKIDFVSLLATEDDDERNHSRKSSVTLSTQDSKRWKVTSKKQSVPLDKQNQDEDTEQKLKEETKATGSVGFKLYVNYFKMGRAPIRLFFTVGVFLLAQVGLSATDFFLSMWTNAENKRMSNSTLDEGQEDEGDSSYLGRNTYIYIYSGIIAATFALCTFRSLFFFNYSTRVGINMHNFMFSSLVRAKIRFFDENPSGRIMNRFTKDLGSADELLPPVFFDMLIIFSHMVGNLVVIVISNYYMAPLAVVVTIILLFIRKYYVSTARDVKRIEGVAKSPLFTLTSSSFTGLSTIRALRVEPTLIKQFDSLQDTHTSAWFLFFSTARCFGVWVEIISVLFLAVVSFSFLLMQDSVQIGNVGLAISSALTLSGELQYGLRQTAEVENLMTSVERCLEYSDLPSEAPLDSNEDKKPPKDWPSKGGVKFSTVSLAYNPDDETPLDVLKQVTFEISPGEKIGIVGRTGAGKSSIIAALFRLAEPEGEIVIDQVKINEIGLHDLRRGISIIPQEPVLFSGTMRYNLDPFQEFPDDQLWSALADVEMKQAVPALDYKVADGGSNFSVGQRQLVCLARAILRNNKIIVMDEVTSNVDPTTDLLIQKTIRSKFSECSIITVAHRLHSIIDCGRILVLDNGKVMEYDHPHLLLENPVGIFTEMVNHTGKSSSSLLKKLAAETYHGRRPSFQVDNLSLVSAELGQPDSLEDQQSSKKKE